MTASANATAASTADDDAPPITAPPRRRLATATTRRRRPDRNRPHEILSALILYVVVVHYALKFATFFLIGEDDVPSREEALGVRGARGVLGFSPSPGAARTTPVGTCSLHRRGGRWAVTVARLLPESLRSGILNGDDVSVGNLTSNDLSTANINRMDNESIRHTADNSTERVKPTRPRTRIPVLSYRANHVIVSKPSGMTMHHNSNTRWGRSKSPVLQTTIRKQLSRKPYLVHRLDHRTSGAVIMGFDSHSAGELHGRLRSPDATKLYVALVRGDLRGMFRRAAAAAVADDGNCAGGVDMSVDGDGSIVGSHGAVPEILTHRGGEEHTPHRENSNIEYNGKISVNRPVKVDGIEKEARTDFFFLSSMEAPDTTTDNRNTNDKLDNDDDAIASTLAASPRVTKSLTLLLCRPRTGRTHQIRRHAQRALRAPVIGDSEHGDSRVNRFWRSEVGLDRLGLHCWYLGLPPAPGDEEDDGIECVAPLTPDFATALRREELCTLWEEATRIEPRLKMEPYDERGGTFGRHYRKKISDGVE